MNEERNQANLEAHIEEIAKRLDANETLSYMEDFFKQSPYARCEYKTYRNKQILADYDEELRYLKQQLNLS